MAPVTFTELAILNLDAGGRYHHTSHLSAVPRRDLPSAQAHADRFRDGRGQSGAWPRRGVVCRRLSCPHPQPAGEWRWGSGGEGPWGRV